jgi:hypothetical protein
MLRPLASLMDVLGVLIEKYEDEQVPELTRKRSFMKRKLTQRRRRASKQRACGFAPCYNRLRNSFTNIPASLTIPPIVSAFTGL